MHGGNRLFSIGSMGLAALTPAVLALSGCGDGGSGSLGAPLAPILQVGMQRQYVGSTTRTVTYTNPTSANPNRTLAYTFTENQAVQQAPSTVNASFDVHTDYAYTVTQDPGIGTAPVSQSVDLYLNLVLTGDTQMSQAVGQDSVVVSNDESANLLGGGPYTQTVTTHATYPTLRYGFSFPLQSGATMDVPQSAAQSIGFTDVNAAGSAPPNGYNPGYTRVRTAYDDGSFSYQTSYANGDSFDMTQVANGTGSTLDTTATATTTTTLGLPDASSGTNLLPVTRSALTAANGVTTTSTFMATDWYPDNGAPDSPLVLQAETVVGPANTLPAQCDGALLRPNIYEIDTTTTSQSTIAATYSVTSIRSFNADGVVVCTLTQETSYAYDLVSGNLVSTTTTDTQVTLNAINY